MAKSPAIVPDVSPYDAIFREAGEEFHVPASLLRSVSYVETRWQMVEGREEFTGVASAHGVMALRGERLAEGARLAGVPESAVRSDARANVRAAAALLASYATTLHVTTDDADEWAPALERFSGIEMADGKESYAREVYAVRGGQRTPASNVSPSRAADPCATTPTKPTTPVVPTAPLADQAGASWRPSPNFNSRMSGPSGQIHMVIIHSCEGSYTGCWSWLANPASEVSAHYVVREDGAEITQLVREPARAWHIGATYDSTLNAGHGHGGVLHGVQSNHFTIGIEHGGFASQTTWPVAQIDASARLLCDIARRWQIPRDRLHIVSHGQLQPYNRTDPGANWPWVDYLARVDKYCTV